jgi:hypothetical protein
MTCSCLLFIVYNFSWKVERMVVFIGIKKPLIKAVGVKLFGQSCLV